MMQGKYFKVKQGKMMDQNQHNRIFNKPFQSKLCHPGLVFRSGNLHGEKTMARTAGPGKGHEHGGTGMHARCSHKKINDKSE